MNRSTPGSMRTRQPTPSTERNPGRGTFRDSALRRSPCASSAPVQPSPPIEQQPHRLAVNPVRARSGAPSRRHARSRATPGPRGSPPRIRGATADDRDPRCAAGRGRRGSRAAPQTCSALTTCPRCSSRSAPVQTASAPPIRMPWPPFDRPKRPFAVLRVANWRGLAHKPAAMISSAWSSCSCTCSGRMPTAPRRI